MGLAATERHTVQDIFNLPEDTRMELIDGFLYDMAAPTSSHQRIVGGLFRKIANHIEAKKGRCETFVAPFAVFVKDDDYNYVEPDIVVVCDPDKVKEDGCHGAPDLIIEVVSESSRKRDYLQKLMIYDSAGVGEYWIVDPEKRCVILYSLGENTETWGMATYRFEDTVVSRLFPEMSIAISDIVSVE